MDAKQWPGAVCVQNNIFVHDGNPPLEYFMCDVSEAVGDDVRCWIRDVQTFAIQCKQYSACLVAGGWAQGVICLVWAYVVCSAYSMLWARRV